MAKTGRQPVPNRFAVTTTPPGAGPATAPAESRRVGGKRPGPRRAGERQLDDAEDLRDQYRRARALDEPETDQDLTVRGQRAGQRRGGEHGARRPGRFGAARSGRRAGRR